MRICLLKYHLQLNYFLHTSQNVEPSVLELHWSVGQDVEKSNVTKFNSLEDVFLFTIKSVSAAKNNKCIIIFTHLK